MALPPDLHSYLAALDDLSIRSRNAWNSADYTLSRMQALVARLKHPQRRYPSVHVAGTNGKGSVCAMLSAALQAQGYRVGLYTSPHLDGPLAGIHLDGRVASSQVLEAAWEKLYPRVADLNGLTVFESVTALAFQVFADQSVEIAVIETGLGGRLDATNVLTPAVSVITPVDLEHTHILGNSLAAIAAEKGGIIKTAVPVVIAPQEADAALVLHQIARQKHAPLIEMGVDYLIERLAFDESGQDIRIQRAGEGAPAQEFHLNLLGGHQALNAAAAYAALQALAETSLPITKQAIRQGFGAVRWPGRLEVVGRQPLVLLDGAHTPAATRALAQALNDHFPQKAVLAVFGISEDKDPDKLLEPLKSRLNGLNATQSRHARALPAAEMGRALGGLDVSVAAGPLPDMLAQAIERMKQMDGLVLVFGSVFLAEEARALLVQD